MHLIQGAQWVRGWREQRLSMGHFCAPELSLVSSGAGDACFLALQLSLNFGKTTKLCQSQITLYYGSWRLPVADN